MSDMKRAISDIAERNLKWLGSKRSSILSNANQAARDRRQLLECIAPALQRIAELEAEVARLSRELQLERGCCEASQAEVARLSSEKQALLRGLESLERKWVDHDAPCGHFFFPMLPSRAELVRSLLLLEKLKRSPALRDFCNGISNMAQAADGGDADPCMLECFATLLELLGGNDAD